MSSVVRLNLVSSHTDWTAQELSEFYRVTDVLGSVGIAVELDRGITDEGDPWVVFCRPGTGEVLAHIARIGREYVVDHALLDTPLRGVSFPDLIDGFLSRFEAGVPLQSARSARLYVHPAASLVALVAALAVLGDAASSDAAAHGASGGTPGDGGAAAHKPGLPLIAHLLSGVFWRAERIDAGHGERRPVNSDFQKSCAITVLAAIAVATDALSDEYRTGGDDRSHARHEHGADASGELPHAGIHGGVDATGLADLTAGVQLQTPTHDDEPSTATHATASVVVATAADDVSVAAPVVAATLETLPDAGDHKGVTFTIRAAGWEGAAWIMPPGADPASQRAAGTHHETTPGPLPLHEPAPAPAAPAVDTMTHPASDLDLIFGSSAQWQSLLVESSPMTDMLVSLVQPAELQASTVQPAAQPAATVATEAVVVQPTDTSVPPVVADAVDAVDATQAGPPLSTAPPAAGTPPAAAPPSAPPPLSTHDALAGLDGDAVLKAFVAFTKDIGIVDVGHDRHNFIVFDRELVATDLAHAHIETITLDSGEHVMLIGLSTTFDSVLHTLVHAA